MPQFIPILAVLISLLAVAGPAGAQQHNAPDGATYQLDDSAFRGDWDRANDLYKFKYAPPGTAGDPIPWDDAFTVGTDGYVMFSSSAAAAAPVHIDGEMIVGAQGLSCTAMTEGALRYNSTGTTVEYCDGSAWTDMAATTSPASPDRSIQFNSGGSFGASGNLVYTSDGDLLLAGSHTGTASVPVSGAGTRMFFDTEMSAFRAGWVPGAQWDDSNIGPSSTAMGVATTASGWGSMAMGTSTTASGKDSTAMGTSTTASGNASTAMGESTTASAFFSTAMGLATTASGAVSTAMGQNSTASGNYSTAIGRKVMAGDGTVGNGKGDYSVAFGLGDSTTSPQLTGQNAAGFFMGAQDNVVFASSNTFGVFGGSMVIDPDDPADKLSADVTLDVDGEIRPGNTGAACAGAIEGALRYNSGGTTVEYCDGSAWSDMAATTSPASPDRGIQFNSGGSFAASSDLTFTADGDLLLAGSHTGTASVPATGAGTRMFFDTEMSAFRAGYVDSTQWDDSNIGEYSGAVGYNTEASGFISTAMGTGTTASGDASTAMGGSTTASGFFSTAMGGSTTASGIDSTAMGNGTTASGSTSTAMGDSTTASGNFSTAMGDDTTASGDTSTAIGREVMAGDGTAGNGKGDYSVAFGLGDSTTSPQLTGQNAAGFFMGAQDNVVFASSNTLGVFGGSMVIDPDDPADKLSADVTLDVDGEIRPGNTGAACAGAIEGALRYNSSGTTVEYCDGSAWTDMAAGTPPADPDRGIQFNSGGSFAASSDLVFTSASNLGIRTAPRAGRPAAARQASGPAEEGLVR